MLAAQGGRCAICGKIPEPGKRGLAVDHDRKCCAGYKSCGECVRGLLCITRNQDLGWFETNESAIHAYLGG